LDNLKEILNGEFEEVIAEMKEKSDNNSELLTGDILTGDIEILT
jgi:hypothetical protein